MESIMEHLLEILLVLFTTTFGILLKIIFDRLDKLENDVQDVRKNYLTRFDDAKTDRFEMKTELVDILNKIDKKLDVHIAKTEK